MIRQAPGGHEERLFTGRLRAVVERDVQPAEGEAHAEVGTNRGSVDVADLEPDMACPALPREVEGVVHQGAPDPLAPPRRGDLDVADGQAGVPWGVRGLHHAAQPALVEGDHSPVQLGRAVVVLAVVLGGEDLVEGRLHGNLADAEAVAGRGHLEHGVRGEGTVEFRKGRPVLGPRRPVEDGPRHAEHRRRIVPSRLHATTVRRRWTSLPDGVHKSVRAEVSLRAGISRSARTAPRACRSRPPTGP